MKRTLLTILLIIALSCVAAQPCATVRSSEGHLSSLGDGRVVTGEGYANVRRFSLRDGLASNVISSIAQTHDQLMWFSSWNGLNCYDGYTFTTFNDHTGHERTLTTNRMLKITPSENNGSIWCLTYDRQVFLFDRSTCRFLNVSAIIDQLLGKAFVCQRIVSLPSGHTWLFSRGEEGPCICIDEQRGLNAKSILLFSHENGKLSGKTVYGVELDDEGREWLCTDGGTAIVGTEQKTPIPYTFVRQLGQHVFLATKDGHFGSYDGKIIMPMRNLPEHIGEVWGLETVGDRYLVAPTDAGLLVYDTKSRQPRLLGGSYGNIHEISIDSRQRIWALTTRGEVLLGTADGQLQQIAVTGAMPTLHQCTRQLVHEDRYGTVWVGTAQGFFGYYDEQTHCLVPYPVRTSAAQPTIDRWYADSRGDLWFSGEHDMAVINFGQRMFTPTVMEPMQQVRSICYDSRGRLWTGDIAGHVAVTDGRNISYLGTDGRLHPQPTLFADHVYCLYEDSRQRLWIGTKGNGLYSVTADGQVCHYRHDSGDAWSLPSNQIYDVHEDRQHRLWIGTFEQGICLLDVRSSESHPNSLGDGRVVTGEGYANSQRFIHAGNLLRNYPVKDFFKVRRITETPDGIIIVAASNGLVAFSEQFTQAADIKFYAHKHVPGDTTSLLTSDVMQACVDHEGRIFVATVGGGLQLVVDRQLLCDKLKLTTAGRMDGDYSTILNMLEDRRGSLWIGRENSLAMHEAETGRLWLFGPGHLGEHTELTEAKPAFNPQTGQIAFATTNGYVSFQPEQIGQENLVPPLVFKSVYFHGTQESVHLMEGDMLDVPATRRNLTIHFAALDYQDNYMIRYAYKLEGIDNDWNYLGTEHNISFSNLPHGCHRLMVRSTNQYGSWADNERVLTLNVHPTFWETWWAKLLYMLLLTGIVAVGVWIYLLRTRAEQERQKSRMLSLLLEEMNQPHDTVSAAEQPEQKPREEDGNVLRLRSTDIVDSDKLMMEQLLAYIEEHLADPDLKIEDLAQAVCLGRTAFYNKVKALVGISPVELLRHIRIRHAEDMVTKSQEPFSQIAYAVGFSDAHYFSKCFKKQTGLTPSEYRERKA